MSAPIATILVVDADRSMVELFRMLIGREPGVAFHSAESIAQARARLTEIQPDLILCDLNLADGDGLALCREIRANPALAQAMFVLVTARADDEVKSRALAMGADDFLRKPVDGAEVQAKWRAVLRLKRLNAELQREHHELAELHGALNRSFDELLDLLMGIVDLSLPGARDRGRRMVDLCSKLADRFEIPLALRKDLTIAAQLCEIGRLVAAGGPRSGALPQTDSQWQYLLASQVVLQQVSGLSGAAALLGAVPENWDGTGAPGRLTQGQIPLRSRILRLVIDFINELESGRPGASAETAAETLQSHSGTRYDPMAVVHLAGVLEPGPARWRQAHLLLPVTALSAGMVLAEDLYTSAGTKLLSRDTRLSPTALEAILRRHSVDPILHGAAVLRHTA